jgi:acyl transferase domain-containing protein
VSSFGLGGTNAHVLVESASPPEPAAVAGEPAPEWSVLPLSAAGPAALRSLAAGLAPCLADPTRLADVAHTLAAGRRRLAHRAAVVARDGVEAVAALHELASGRPAPVPEAAPAAVRARAAAWLDRAEAPDGVGRRIPLPGYPFQRTRHWIEAIR